MNLGILMVQGLVNSFGPIVPVQDFGNAFSTFIAQNYGAKKNDRIRSGLKSAVCISMAFCIVISAFVFIFAKPLMSIFVDANEIEIIQEGVRYLRIEGAFYCTCIYSFFYCWCMWYLVVCSYWMGFSGFYWFILLQGKKERIIILIQQHYIFSDVIDCFFHIQN